MKKLFLSFATLALVASVYSCKETTEERLEDTAETEVMHNDAEEALERADESIDEAIEASVEALNEAGDAVDNAADEVKEANEIN